MHIFLKAPLPPKERLRRHFFHGSGAHNKKRRERKGKRRRIGTLKRPLFRRHLYSPSPLRHGPRGQRMDWLDHRLPQKMPSAAVRVLSFRKGSDAQALGRKLPSRRRDRLRQVRTMHEVRPDPAFGESSADKTLPQRKLEKLRNGR